MSFGRQVDQLLTRVQVYKGSQNAPKEFKDAQVYEEANNWLADRR